VSFPILDISHTSSHLALINPTENYLNVTDDDAGSEKSNNMSKNMQLINSGTWATPSLAPFLLYFQQSERNV
jgi:hypothetical protein